MYIHGGYNTLQPSPFHWRFLDKLTLSTLHEVVFPIYPKAPDYHINDTQKAVKDVYDQLVSEVGAEHIIVMGDGSGGGLALNLVQSLIEQNEQVPRQLYLISPLLDATLSNKDITDDLLDKDILVSRFGVNEIMKRWADECHLPIHVYHQYMARLKDYHQCLCLVEVEKLLIQICIYLRIHWNQLDKILNFMNIQEWFMIFHFIRFVNHIKLLNKLPKL